MVSMREAEKNIHIMGGIHLYVRNISSKFEVNWIKTLGEDRF